MSNIIDDIYHRAAMMGYDLGGAVDEAAYDVASAAAGGVSVPGDWSVARQWARDHWQELVPDVVTRSRGQLYEDYESPLVPDAQRLVVDLIEADYMRRAICYRFGSWNRAMQAAPVPTMPPLGTV